MPHIECPNCFNQGAYVTSTSKLLNFTPFYCFLHLLLLRLIWPPHRSGSRASWGGHPRYSSRRQHEKPNRLLLQPMKARPLLPGFFVRDIPSIRTSILACPAETTCRKASAGPVIFFALWECGRLQSKRQTGSRVSLGRW